MALKFKLDSLDGLDEGLKSLYTKGEDGKFTLQLEDDPAKATMQKLRQELADKEKALKDREKAEADAKAAKEREELERKGEYEKLKASLEAEKATVLKEKEEALSGLKSYLLKSELTAAIAANKGNPHLLKLVADQFEAVLSPDGNHKVLSKIDPTKTPAQIIESLKKDATYQPFFEGSGASGGGAHQSDGKAPEGKPTTSVELIAAGLKEAAIR